MNGWHRGPPPSVGWWPTQYDAYDRNEGVRWWNGEFWSFMPTNNEPEHVNWCARQRCSHRDILWSARPAGWPERSRT